MKSELSTSEMQKAVILYASKLGCFLWRNNTMGVWRGTGYQNTGGILGGLGSPDLVGLLPNGKFLGIEVKNGNEQLSVEQIAFRDKIFDHNGYAFVCTAKHFQEFLDTLRQCVEANRD